MYRYGFNGKENDNEVKGEGNQQDYGMRIYDPRVGRFLSVDPITKEYPELTPYQFASNRPIDGTDLDGLEYNNATTFVNKTIPEIKVVNANIFLPQSEPTILMFNPFLNVGEIGPQSEVIARIQFSRNEYNRQVGDNIRGGLGGTFGFFAGGDRGSFIGGFFDGISSPLMRLPGRSTVFPNRFLNYQNSNSFLSSHRPTSFGFKNISTRAYFVSAPPKPPNFTFKWTPPTLPSAAKTGINQTSKAILKNGYYEVNGFKFSEFYYNKLWNTGRGAPSLVAKEVLEGGAKTAVPDAEKAGFNKYIHGGWEMIYNPATKEVWHLQPIRL